MMEIFKQTNRNDLQNHPEIKGDEVRDEFDGNYAVNTDQKNQEFNNDIRYDDAIYIRACDEGKIANTQSMSHMRGTL